MAGTVSQRWIGSSVVCLRQTLSGHVQLPPGVWRVGTPLGRARSMLYLKRRLIRGAMNSSGSNSHSLQSSSHIG